MNPPVSPLREVIAYEWQGPTPITVEALDYWDGSITRDGKKRYIVVPEKYNDWPEPDIEHLACGHSQPLRVWNNQKVYSRRRRCQQCALASL